MRSANARRKINQRNCNRSKKEGPKKDISASGFSKLLKRKEKEERKILRRARKQANVHGARTLPVKRQEACGLITFKGARRAAQIERPTLNTKRLA